MKRLTTAIAIGAAFALVVTIGASAAASAGMTGTGRVAAGEDDDVDLAGNYTVTSFGTATCVPRGSSGAVFECETTGLLSQYSGSLTGSSTTDFEEIIDCNTGRFRGHGVETYTGPVAGVGSGTLTWRIRFRGTFDCATETVLSFAGKGLIRAGSGDLAGFEGELEFGLDTYGGELE